MKELVFVNNGNKIVFDDFVDDRKDYQCFWTGICEQCRRRYAAILKDRIDEGSAAIGNCSVKGCYNEVDTYVDFTEEDVIVKEI